MTREEFYNLLNFEEKRKKIVFTREDRIAIYAIFCDKLENSDYYLSLDPESDAAYSFRDDLFTECLDIFLSLEIKEVS